MGLTKIQKKLVEDHLFVVEQVIRYRININKQKRGLENDDLYQVGSLGLCKAVTKYKADKGVC